MQEVFETSEVLIMSRSSIIDVTFVRPIDGIADSMYHCIGISNAYFIQFALSHDGSSLLTHHEICKPVLHSLSKRIFILSSY